MKVRIKIKNVLLYCGIILVALVYVVPYFILVLASFKSPINMFRFDRLFSFKLTLANYASAITDYRADLALRNNFIVTMLTVVTTIAISTLAAYALTRFEFRGRKTLALDILTLRMFPPMAVAIPIYLLAAALGLFNTYWILILLNTVFNLPIGIWLIKTFIASIPIEVEEAAMLDGCTRLQILTKIVLPLLLPGLTATATVLSIFVWNEALFALFLTRSVEMRTLSVLATETLKARYVAWGEACAIGVIATVPLMILFALASKYIIRALTFGLVK